MTFNGRFRVFVAILLSVVYSFSSAALFSFSLPLAPAMAAEPELALASADAPTETGDPEARREIEIGRKAVAQIEEQAELVADPAKLARLTMIVEKLKPHLEREFPYEVRIIRSDTPNAFCLPGGFIFFTTRMLEMLHSDSEIAAVMAHEMIHVDRSHGVRMESKAEKVNAISLAALAAILLSGGAMAPIVLTQVAQVAIVSAYTIEFEKEADSLGLDVLIAAGYSPTAMVTLMEGFMHEEMKQPIYDYGISMDHPDSIERVQSMSEKLKALNISLERKIPLQLLRTSIQEKDNRISLTVDGAEVWGGPESGPARNALERARKLLDADFQMELAPYDLQLEDRGEGQSLLRLKNNVLAKTPLPEGMPDLASFRANLLASLARAQAKHPIAKYFQ